MTLFSIQGVSNLLHFFKSSRYAERLHIFSTPRSSGEEEDFLCGA
jgi:hypothetical protein